MLFEIDEPGDDRIRLYRGLTDRALREQVESEHGVFVVEGSRALRQLVHSGWTVRSLLLLPSRVDGLTDVISRTEAPVYVAPAAVVDEITGFPVHRGVLALGERRPDPPLTDLLAGVDLVLAIEGVNDHENLGALFRNAAAFGVGAVLLDPTCCDPLYRRAVRVSVGHVLRVPFGRMPSLAALGDTGLDVLALDPGAAQPIETAALTPPLVLLVGSEGDGLSDQARSLATHQARIAMAHGVDSLNVATAAAVALHQIRLSWRR